MSDEHRIVMVDKEVAELIERLQKDIDRNANALDETTEWMGRLAPAVAAMRAQLTEATALLQAAGADEQLYIANVTRLEEENTRWAGELHEAVSDLHDSIEKLQAAEAQIAAVASVRDRLLQQAVVFRLNPQVHSTYRECADRITKALTPATSPGADHSREASWDEYVSSMGGPTTSPDAGEGTKCGVTAWNRWSLPCDREPGHTGTHSHDPTPGRSGK